MNDKIMAGVNLENIVRRLIYGCAVLEAIRETDNPLVDALAGVEDLFQHICQDLEADISAAEDWPEGGRRHVGRQCV